MPVITVSYWGARVQVRFSLTPNPIDSKNVTLRRPVWKFLAFGFLQKSVYLPHPWLDLSYPFLLFPSICPVFLPTSLPQVTASPM